MSPELLAKYLEDKLDSELKISLESTAVNTLRYPIEPLILILRLSNKLNHISDSIPSVFNLRIFCANR